MQLSGCILAVWYGSAYFGRYQLSSSHQDLLANVIVVKRLSEVDLAVKR